MGLYNWADYDSGYFTKAALAGGICCSITHGGVVPIDVVKTKIQLEPTVYNKGMLDAAKSIVKNEGVMGLTIGLAPTALGYFVQGWFKFGGVELCKINFAKALGDEKAWTMRQPIYLASAAIAEFVADIFLCPLEACRIRLVSDPTYASSMPATMAKMASEEGVVKAFYSGFGPILFKQVPYTMAKFAVQGLVAEKIYNGMGTSPEKCGTGLNTGVSLGSGTVAGVVAAIISHPADTLLSKMNKAGAGGTGSIPSRMMNVTKEMGIVNLCMTGLGARCVMIGTLTALQFGIFDTVLRALGASKFHFHDPKKH